MKLKRDADLNLFLQTVRQCHDEIYFTTPENDSLNLQSVLSQYLFASLAGKPELLQAGEILCRDMTDMLRLSHFLE